MQLTDQTQTDLKSILETLEQRLYEVGTESPDAGPLEVLIERTQGYLSPKA